MFTLDKDLIVAYQRIDDPDAPEVDQLIAAACSACVAYTNRAIYEDAAEQSSTLAQLDAAAQAAETAYNDAIAAAEEIESDVVKTGAVKRATMQYNTELRRIDSAANGIVATDDIRAAAMLLFGSYWRNREDEVAGSSAATAALPFGARAILDRYTYWLEIP